MSPGRTTSSFRCVFDRFSGLHASGFRVVVTSILWKCSGRRRDSKGFLQDVLKLFGRENLCRMEGRRFVEYIGNEFPGGMSEDRI